MTTTLSHLRRLYHHMLNGGSITPNDLSMVIARLEGVPHATPTSWSAEVDGMLLAPDSEAEAVETWEVGEFELGLIVVIHRGYTIDV